jgi:transposase
MKKLPELAQLSSEAKDALIVELWEELQKLKNKPQKTSKNSSLPPAKGFKAQVKKGTKKGKGRLGREGGGRALEESPDQMLKAEVKKCEGCGDDLTGTVQQLMQRYDKIDIPPIKPVVTRVERYGCTCPNCGQVQIAAVPIEMVPGSPFGNRIAALVTTMRYSHGISYSRMKQMLSEVFGLEISEGAIDNMLSRVQGQLEWSVDEILTKLRSARIVCSDETSARVNGKNQWEWVFQNEQVCFHIIKPSRGGNVIEEVMGGQQPEVWVSDLFSAQKTHPAEEWQVCLAHQIRDCQYGIDAGDAVFSARMKKLILRAIVLHKRWPGLAESTRHQYKYRLNRKLQELLELKPTQEDGIRLQKRYQDLQKNLFIFLDDPEVPTTNNSSEQALRWSVIFRKITNGFRSDWGKDLFAAVRSIVNTGRRQGMSAFESILAALNPLESLFLLG